MKAVQTIPSSFSFREVSSSDINFTFKCPPEVMQKFIASPDYMEVMREPCDLNDVTLVIEETSEDDEGDGR